MSLARAINSSITCAVSIARFWYRRIERSSSSVKERACTTLLCERALISPTSSLRNSSTARLRCGMPRISARNSFAGRPRPKFSWRFEPDGSIAIDTETRPLSHRREPLLEMGDQIAGDDLHPVLGADDRFELRPFGLQFLLALNLLALCQFLELWVNLRPLRRLQFELGEPALVSKTRSPIAAGCRCRNS